MRISGRYLSLSVFRFVCSCRKHRRDSINNLRATYSSGAGKFHSSVSNCSPLRPLYLCRNIVVISDNQVANSQKDNSYVNFEQNETRIKLVHFLSLVEHKKEIGAFQREYKVNLYFSTK